MAEKSLGCIHKGGSKPIRQVYDYAKQVDPGRGAVIMDTPGNDPSSVAAMVAGGAQLIVFSTGRGTPTGNPIAPVIKITGNRETYERMRDNMDADASCLMEGGSLEKLGQEFFDLLLQVANGRKTKAELLGFMEIGIARVCNYV